jgi:hypothetical protein
MGGAIVIELWLLHVNFLIKFAVMVCANHINDMNVKMVARGESKKQPDCFHPNNGGKSLVIINARI